MANLDLLNEAIDENDLDEMQYSMGKIEQQLERMSRIISGVLDIDRLRKDAGSFHECVPEQAIRNSLNNLQTIAQDKNIALDMQIDSELPIFWSDEKQFERVLDNLIENAIKFTPEGGFVTVSAYTQDERIVFRVADTGIGIPVAQQSRVFDSFFRANQKGAEHISGSGLGLHLVKTIVQQHNGKIWLESEENIGTTFYVSLPLIQNGMMSSSNTAY